MRNLLLVLLFIFAVQNIQAGNGEDIFKKMHATYAGKWFKTLQFKQETKFYRNDSLLQTDIWHEWVSFPYHLRIDRGESALGNTAIYTKDSTVAFRNGKRNGARAETNPFIFFLGGMYHLPLTDDLEHLKKEGYDLSKSFETNWKGRETFVLGAKDVNDTTSNQFWVDKRNLYVVRIMMKRGNNFLDVRLSDHIKAAGGWSETFVEFFSKGKLIQTEKYMDVVPNRSFSEKLFDKDNYVTSAEASDGK
jgi:hypothetical protein